MSYSIALTAASKFDLILCGSSIAGLGAGVWLISHYVTQLGHLGLEKLEDSNGSVANVCRKILKVVVGTFEFMKLFALYGAGIGFSAAAAAIVGCYSIPSIAVLILGSTFAGVYALAQTYDRLNVLFAKQEQAI